MSTFQDLSRPNKPLWCPGCGNFIILKTLKEALAELDIPAEQTAVVSGIGQAGKFPHYVNTYGFHGLHGRVLPISSGVKLANHELTVIAVGGDGDGYSMGMGHMIHTIRRNLDITYLVHNNQVYGLTKGQTSPTSGKGFKSKTTPQGSIELPVNPIALALAAGSTFVARASHKYPDQLRELIIKGIQHRGFALIDLIQYCITFNRVNTPAWWDERMYWLEDEGHNMEDKGQAMLRALEWGDRIPFGLFYQESLPSYEDQLPQLAHGPLAKANITDVDITPVMETFY